MEENKNAAVNECNLASEDRQRINDMIYDLFYVDKAKIVPKANLKEDLSCDSLDLIELTMVLERNFRICIPDIEAEQMKTVADVYATVYRKISEK